MIGLGVLLRLCRTFDIIIIIVVIVIIIIVDGVIRIVIINVITIKCGLGVFFLPSQILRRGL